jgi:hypothetical protein
MATTGNSRRRQRGSPRLTGEVGDDGDGGDGHGGEDADAAGGAEDEEQHGQRVGAGGSDGDDDGDAKEALQEAGVAGRTGAGRGLAQKGWAGPLRGKADELRRLGVRPGLGAAANLAYSALGATVFA